MLLSKDSELKRLLILDFLDKSTWALAVMLVLLILASNFAIDNSNQTLESKALNTEEIETQALPFDNSQDLTLPVDNN
jgi:preprotein translocase subunit SecG